MCPLSDLSLGAFMVDYQTAPAVWLAYSQDRKGEHPRQHLKGFRGALQADPYSGVHHLYGEGAIYKVACWARDRPGCQNL
jgi:transposase